MLVKGHILSVYTISTITPVIVATMGYVKLLPSTKPLQTKAYADQPPFCTSDTTMSKHNS